MQYDLQWCEWWRQLLHKFYFQPRIELWLHFQWTWHYWIWTLLQIVKWPYWMSLQWIFVGYFESYKSCFTSQMHQKVTEINQRKSPSWTGTCQASHWASWVLESWTLPFWSIIACFNTCHKRIPWTFCPQEILLYEQRKLYSTGTHDIHDGFHNQQCDWFGLYSTLWCLDGIFLLGWFDLAIWENG